MDKAIAAITAKTEDLEACSRRNNLRLMGIAESTQTGNMEHYVETLLINLLGRDNFSGVFIVERAHRSLAPPPPPAGRPRPIIAKILSYRDRDAALRKARELGKLQHDGMDISLYPDFTSQVQEARKKFLDSKKKLRENNISYAMMYPARITDDGKSKIFNEPKAALKYLQLKHPRTTRRKSPRELHTEQENTSDVE